MLSLLLSQSPPLIEASGWEPVLAVHRDGASGELFRACTHSFRVSLVTSLQPTALLSLQLTDIFISPPYLGYMNKGALRTTPGQAHRWNHICTE